MPKSARQLLISKAKFEIVGDEQCAFISCKSDVKHVRDIPRHRQEERPDMRMWEAHVLANVPFYAVLLPLFLALLRSRVSTQGNAALADLAKVKKPLPLPSLLPWENSSHACILILFAEHV